MAMKLEDVINRPIEDLQDAVEASVMFGHVKHDTGQTFFDVINSMDTSEFLWALTCGLEILNQQREKNSDGSTKN